MTNQDIIEKYNLRLKDQWVKDNIGIHQRHWCQNNESASDLGTEVLSILLEKDPKQLSALIVSTVSQDFMTPATATILQNNVTPGQTYPVFDLTAACSGFIYAIDTARRLVQTGHKKVACVATEIRSYYLNKKDRRTVMLFGDGAGGLTLEPCAEGEVGIIDSKLLADGRHYNSIVVTGSGSQRVKEEDPKDIVEMRDAVKIFGSAVEEMKNLVNEMLDKHGLNIYDVNYFIIHQASKVIVEKVAETLGIPKEKYILNFPEKGNMTSASTAVALSEAVEQGKINKGDIVLMLATGGGFTAGVTLFRWEL
jgi:3-oxoacyl-[acyl-carrier-protein] synthase-3